ncbi:ATP-dependent DNA helicase RecG [Falsihalocynthiibacter arcticus]|uniref:ATP-dependent DNA helicase RecG n=1 Tax=Falsihalocynthiibacter arcticus TaxID=1579316 RepID=A0A126V4G9_9RHOB|nr:ATP-dependent DNA helicase RecG [Falsihalocynthiibacter arcticus]AML52766.1 ATP-dependent DNA helicase RecG [Falsihalocynthiibacter arcticus]
MSSRPEGLFPLFSDLKTLDGVGPKASENFARMSIGKPRDLLFLLPFSGVDRRPITSVIGADAPCVVTVEVEILNHKPAVSRGRPYRIYVQDAQTTLQLVFFHARQDYLEKILPIGERRIVSGKLEVFDGIAQIVHPDHIVELADATLIPEFEPVYPSTVGITQKVISKAVAATLERLPELGEWIDPSLKGERGWGGWKESLNAAHNPESNQDLSPESMSRQRLAYDEFFAHQLTLALARNAARKLKGKETKGEGLLFDRVLKTLPFVPTEAQYRAIEEIRFDMAQPFRMNRLLQGDVGAGKTLVALAVLLNAVESGGQGVMMAPTEILARQHLEGLRPLAQTAGVNIEILTGRDKGKERTKKLEALACGAIQILVGTHAVFQDDVVFNDLRLAVVDEQHRFGVEQRARLGAKGKRADVLVMTATPIPRSLALAQFGDLDVSILDEKPAGRQPISTVMVTTGRIDEIVSSLRKAVSEGKQAYWVCPLVEESELIDMTAAEDRFKNLRAELGENVVTLVHGQMPSQEKDQAMAQFVAGERSVLVATTVIEVGVDVPNATIMVIERAESFGLAQLHQLRGRVGRGAGKSTCVLLYQPPLSKTGQRRLEILRESEDGFRIAQEDLEIRGAGDVIGTAQSGIPRFAIADLERQAALMAIAQKDARTLLTLDPELISPRGQAARSLLWLMEQDKAIRLISVG